jgi:hypothetical protein
MVLLAGRGIKVEGLASASAVVAADADDVDCGFQIFEAGCVASSAGGLSESLAGGTAELHGPSPVALGRLLGNEAAPELDPVGALRLRGHGQPAGQDQQTQDTATFPQNEFGTLRQGKSSAPRLILTNGLPAAK